MITELNTLSIKILDCQNGNLPLPDAGKTADPTVNWQIPAAAKRPERKVV